MCWIKQFHCNALRAKSFMRTKSFVMSKVNLKLLRASITSYNEPILVYNKSRWRRVKNTSHIFYFIETQQAESSRVDEKKKVPASNFIKSGSLWVETNCTCSETIRCIRSKQIGYIKSKLHDSNISNTHQKTPAMRQHVCNIFPFDIRHKCSKWIVWYYCAVCEF